MESHRVHDRHEHEHKPGCGHPSIEHDGHRDFLHEGHLHHRHGDHYDEHVIPVSEQNPAACTSGHACQAHGQPHRHGPACGHESVPHGDHTDYVVSGHLHHPHDGHCDDHGAVTLSRTA